MLGGHRAGGRDGEDVEAGAAGLGHDEAVGAVGTESGERPTSREDEELQRDAFLGEGLASVDDGPTYKALRRIMNPAFRKITTDG